MGIGAGRLEGRAYGTFGSKIHHHKDEQETCRPGQIYVSFVFSRARGLLATQHGLQSALIT